MVRTTRTVKIAMVSVPVIIFLILQSLGIGGFSMMSILEPRPLLLPTSSLRTGPMISQSGPDVYVAWTAVATNQDVFFRASNDAGRTFEPLVNLSNTPGTSHTRSIASKGSAVYVGWVDDSSGNLDVYLRRSVDGGRTFDPVINLSSNSGNSEFPSIEVEGPVVYTTWVDDTYGSSEISFRVSHDAGATFAEAINLSNSEGNSESPTIAAEGPDVYVLWHDDTGGNFDVFLRASHDSGKTFGPAINLSNSEGNAGFAVVVVDGASVSVAWIDLMNGRQDIFSAVSRDAGETFSSPVNLIKSDARSTLPTIDADGPLVCVSWIDEATDIEMYVSCSVEGQYFAEPISIARGENIRSNAIHVEGKDVYSFWLETGSSVNGLFLSASNDGGKTFAPSVNIALGKIDSGSIVAEGTNVYVLWSDSRCEDEACTMTTVNAYFGRSTNQGRTFEIPARLN